MKIIGLTGGIGSGKSTVSTYLTKKGFLIVDADQIARRMTETGAPVLKELAAFFGDFIIREDGSLDRKALATIAFSTKEQKENLDNIMLESIINKIQQQLQHYEESGESVLFIDAPLLFEANLDKLCAETWVVDVEDEVRIRRVMERDRVSKDDVVARINNQMGRNEKKARADFILNNSSTQEELYQQIDELLLVKIK